MYNYVTDGRTVSLHVLANADSSLVGLKFKNCEIKQITVYEMANLLACTYGSSQTAIFKNSVVSHLLVTEKGESTKHLEDLPLIVLEEINPISFESFSFFKVIKLYKSIDLYPCYSMNYKMKDDRLTWGGLGKVTDYPHAIGFNACKFAMTDQEKEVFPVWFEQHKEFARNTETNEQFQKVLRTYHLSYYIGFPELEYVMLFTILEMLFGGGHTEITYQIARGAALLMSNNADEMVSISKKMKKLYTARSKYVHEGISIQSEQLFELREFVRKIILKVIEMDYHRKESTFEELRNMLFYSGVEKL